MQGRPPNKKEPAVFSSTHPADQFRSGAHCAVRSLRGNGANFRGRVVRAHVFAKERLQGLVLDNAHPIPGQEGCYPDEAHGADGAGEGGGPVDRVRSHQAEQ
jgi:hypothetical protein